MELILLMEIVSLSLMIGLSISGMIVLYRKEKR